MEELDDIIRYGSKELFVEENGEGGKARQIHYDDAAIERLLNRGQIGGDDPSIDKEEDGLLKAFKVANFEYIDEIEAEAAAAKEEEARKQYLNEKTSFSNSDKSNYWEDLLRDRYEMHQVEEFTAMGKGKRSRKQMTTAEEDDLAGVQVVSSEDEDYSCEDDLSESEMTLPGNSSGRRGRYSRKRARAEYIESLPLMEGEGKPLRILGFSQLQRATFFKTLMRFGFGEYDWKEFVPRLKGKSFEEVHEYGFLFLRHVDEGINDSPTFSDGVPKEGLRVDDVLVRLAHITLIKEKLKFLKENPGFPLFPEDVRECYPSLIGRVWKERHEIFLLKAILRHGYARWQAIVEDKELGLSEVGHQELGLPVITLPSAGGVPMGDGASNYFNEASDPAKGSQSNSDYSTFHQFKEVQRRIVEFIRKRYQLLEKILDLELCLEESEKANQCGSIGEDPEIEPVVTQVPSETLATGDTLLKELPYLEPIGT